MRTFCSVMLMSVLMCGTVYAQSENRIRDRGVKLGLGLSTLAVTVTGLQSAAEHSYGSGLVGFFITYSLQPRLYLQPEITYASRGAGGEFLRGRSWRHDYVELPVLLKYELTRPAKWTPSLFAGPAFGYLAAAKYKPSFLSDEIDVKDAAKSLDFSIVLGGALDYRSMTLDMRYTMGMVNLYDAAKWNDLVGSTSPTYYDYMTPDDSMKSRSLIFALGYRF